jgi:hypothetical protein
MKYWIMLLLLCVTLGCSYTRAKPKITVVSIEENAGGEDRVMPNCANDATVTVNKDRTVDVSFTDADGVKRRFEGLYAGNAWTVLDTQRDVYSAQIAVCEETEK